MIDANTSRLRLRGAKSLRDFELAAKLFNEYATSLGIDLGFQGFAKELLCLVEMYAPSQGCLLLAGRDGLTGGCGAIRRLDDYTCEMKRLYVRPSLRGLGAGNALAQALIARACALGYDAVRLDTLASMASAIRLYRSLGFREIPAYYETPLQGTLFFELSLDPTCFAADEVGREQ